MISYSPTPIQEIDDPLFKEAGVRLWIKREDLNHPFVSGNKWWKLRYNLEHAIGLSHDTLLTFGGAYSNHLFAVAAAAAALNLKSIGVVRGEETLPLNSTLSFAKKAGMQLHYLSRQLYREKSSAGFVEELERKFGKFFLIPEGGTNADAVRGCREWGANLVAEVDFDILCLPVGTGGTLAGLVQSLRAHQQAIGFSVLRNGSFLVAEVQRWLPPGGHPTWRIETRFDFGGYAKRTESLRNFMSAQQSAHRLPLDPVYTAKTLYGIYAMVRDGAFPRSTRILMIHTGGLQANSLTE